MTPFARWPALITLMFVAVAGPQATLVLSAFDFLRSDMAQDPDCPASMCKTRECCCASPSKSGCQIGPSRCPSFDSVPPAVAKVVIPSRPAASLPCERPAPLAATQTAKVEDGFDRRPERPPRATS